MQKVLKEEFHRAGIDKTKVGMRTQRPCNSVPGPVVS